MKKLVFVWCLGFATIPLHAQSSQSFMNSYNGIEIENGFSICQAIDSSYLITGNSTPTGGNADGLLMKVDRFGNIVWSKKYGGVGGEYFYRAIETPGKDIIMAGSTYSFGAGGLDMCLIRVNRYGDTLWAKTYGGAGNDDCASAMLCSDNGILLFGTTNSFGSGGYDFLVIKTDSTGDVIWSKTIGTTQAELVASAIGTSDNGFILGGRRFTSYPDILLTKLDSAGNILWTKSYGGTKDDHLTDLKRTGDGGFIFTGTTQSFRGNNTAWDMWVVKIDSGGVLQWSKIYDTYNGSALTNTRSIIEIVNGYLIVGETQVAPNLANATILIRTQSNGDTVWSRTFFIDAGKSAETFDGGGVILGKKGGDIYLLKVDSIANFSCSHINVPGFVLDVTPSVSSPTMAVLNVSIVVSPASMVTTIRSLQRLDRCCGTGTTSITGIIQTEIGLPIPNVTITLDGDDSLTVITDTTGRYNFTVPQCGSYTITLSKSNDVTANNGITAVDVLLMRRHILGNGALGSPYKIIAAAEVSADGDTTITTQDIHFTRSLILGNITSFPTNRLWQFVSSDYVFPDTQHPFPFDKTRTYTNITTNQTNQDFIGIKLGDANGSWDPNTP